MAFNLLLQLLRIETLCSSEASLRGCLDEILCLPLKTRVKSCPHCQKQNDQCDLPSHPRSIGYLLNHQFSHFQFLMQILHIQLHSWILRNQGVNFLWQLWILLLYFLATFAETNKKNKAAPLYVLWVCWCPCHKFTILFLRAARITEMSHLVTFCCGSFVWLVVWFLHWILNLPSHHLWSVPLAMFCGYTKKGSVKLRNKQNGLTFVCTVPVSGCLAPSLTLYYAGEKGNYCFIYRL